jgi:deoxyadenosine/deoxycytidine kinase
MDKNEKTIYIISGPCGAGKSTIAKELSRYLQKSVLIVGDDIMSMFEDDNEPPWDEWLELTWKNILSLTSNFVQHDYDVVIDYIVETELEWFFKQTTDLNVEIKYVVLRADEEKLIERLNKRGDPQLVDRSLALLNQLGSSAENQNHLYDTTHKLPAEIIKDIVSLSRFTFYS